MTQASVSAATPEQARVGQRFRLALRKIKTEHKAARLNISQAALGRICRGLEEPSPVLLQRLQQVTGVSANWVLYGLHGSLPVVQDRPRTSADCVDGPRPCPWVGCRMHLYLHVTSQGAVLYKGELDDMQETCALDVAERGPHSNEQVASLLNLSVTRVTKIVTTAFDRSAGGLEGFR